MRGRKDILNDLISMNGDISVLLNELSLYPWDREKPITNLNRSDILLLLTKALHDNNIFNKLEDWADAIEVRDDIEFENDQVKNVVTELANPILYGALTKERLKLIINSLV